MDYIINSRINHQGGYHYAHHIKSDRLPTRSLSWRLLGTLWDGKFGKHVNRFLKELR